MVIVLQVGTDRISRQGKQLSRKQRELCLESAIYSGIGWNGRAGRQRKEKEWIGMGRK